MSLGGFFRAIFGIGGDHRGWQNNEPLGSVIEGSTQVSPDLSMQLSAVYACVNLISSTIASLPCDVFLISEDGSRKPDKACSLAMLLGNSPNYNMSPFEFWQAMTRSLLLRGNAYALIGRKRDGSAYSITPLSADQMNVKRNEETGFVEYHYYNDKNQVQVLDPANVFHWKHLGDGYIGLSTIEYMRGTLTEAASAQGNAVDMFAGGGQVTGIIKPVGILTPQQKVDTVRGFSQLRSKGKGILILDRQMDFQQLALTPAQTQLLETRRFSVEEICRWFGVPTGLVGGTGDIEKEEGWFYKSTILPLCISAEQAIAKRIACKAEKHHEVRFRLSFLYRANDYQRTQIYATQLQNGMRTRADIAREEGWEVGNAEGMDIHTVQSNLMRLEDVGRVEPTKEETPLSSQPDKN